MKNESRELELMVNEVKEIARLAGEKILEVYSDGDLFHTQTKVDQSPLTQADLRSNAEIVKGLSSMPWPFPILSEESKMIDYTERSAYDYFWMVDPLDGTKEFIKRNGEFTVNIALIHKAKPILGVVYVPVSNDLFWGYRCGGAFHEGSSGVARLTASSFRMTDPGLRVVCSRSHINAKTKSFIDGLDGAETVSRGSSLKFILLAQGRAELYPRLGPTMEWDTAAAHIILEESGGSIVQYESGEALQYNKQNLLNPFFVARAKLIDHE